jgi:predicted nucleotidyltransferase
MDLSDIDPRFRADLETAIRYLLSKGCSEVYLFGSLGTGTPQDGSDIDIAVRGIRPEEFFRIYGELLTQLRHEVDLVDLDLQADFGRILTETGSLRRVA